MLPGPSAEMQDRCRNPEAGGLCFRVCKVLHIVVRYGNMNEYDDMSDNPMLCIQFLLCQSSWLPGCLNYN